MQTLKIGDKVRCVSLPGGWMHDETRVVYVALIRTGFILTVDQIDEFGYPWTEPFDLDEAGHITTESGIGHTLVLNDESWERVQQGK